jgi:hypothetical protein
MKELVRGIPLFFFLFFAAMPALVAVALVVEGLRARRRAALITATPTANIGMAADGYREFEGRTEAIAGKTAEAPLTATPCVWYHVKIEKWRPGRREQSPSWTTVMEHTSQAPFFLRDSTGVCVVEPDGAEVTPTDKSVWEGATLKPEDRNPPRGEPGHTPQPIVDIASTKEARYRYTEERIYADVPLLVLGEFSQRRFEDLGEDDDEEDGDDDDIAEIVDESRRAREAGELPAGARRDEYEPHPMWADETLAGELIAAARETTTAAVGRGSGRQPFMLSTKLQAVHVATADMAAQAALPLAAAAAGVVAFLFWLRFG